MSELVVPSACPPRSTPEPQEPSEPNTWLVLRATFQASSADTSLEGLRGYPRYVRLGTLEHNSQLVFFQPLVGIFMRAAASRQSSGDWRGQHAHVCVRH
mmetsp:Transcript_34141/g.90129  ORF Transcript_34141/g.90129 Transcript_34141/m.90129 type:complete len:99 (+) Transcript_34141:1054-1350(+)